MAGQLAPDREKDGVVRWRRSSAPPPGPFHVSNRSQREKTTAPADVLRAASARAKLFPPNRLPAISTADGMWRESPAPTELEISPPGTPLRESLRAALGISGADSVHRTEIYRLCSLLFSLGYDFRALTVDAAGRHRVEVVPCRKASVMVRSPLIAAAARIRCESSRRRSTYCLARERTAPGSRRTPRSARGPLQVRGPSRRHQSLIVALSALTGTRAAFILAGHTLFTDARGTTSSALLPLMREMVPESHAWSFSAASRR